MSILDAIAKPVSDVNPLANPPIKPASPFASPAPVQVDAQVQSPISSFLSKPISTVVPDAMPKANPLQKLDTTKSDIYNTVKYTTWADVANLAPYLINAVASPVVSGLQSLAEVGQKKLKELGVNNVLTNTDLGQHLRIPGFKSSQDQMIPGLGEGRIIPGNDIYHNGDVTIKGKFIPRDTVYDSQGSQSYYDEQIKNGVDPDQAYANTVVKTFGDMSALVPILGGVSKAAILRTAPEKLITPEAINVEKTAMQDYLTGRTSQLPVEVPDIAKKAITETLANGTSAEKRNLFKGMNILQVKPSALGNILGIDQTQAESILKSLYGNPVREASAGALPGYTEKPNPQAGGMNVPNQKTPVGFEPAKPEPYTPSGDLTLKTLDRLTGKTEVSKQYISDLSKGQDVKAPEREAIAKILSDYPDDQPVPVGDFATKVQSELLPLEQNTGGNDYENISLQGKDRGDVENYHVRIFQSPIKTSAGDVHFGTSYDAMPGEESPINGYFAHSRIEDMGDKSTRRVIELQSDLFQKGRLENEAAPLYEQEWAKAQVDPNMTEITPKRQQEIIDESKKTVGDAEKKIKALEPYRNTWHERIIREEIKQAAKDGKTKLQFPTGETAMKIEGLGQGNRSFYIIPESAGGATIASPRLTIENMKTGTPVAGAGGTWIITDVLGDGKFKAVQKAHLSSDLAYFTEMGADTTELKKLSNGEYYHPSDTETFDISGKVDQNNPIYKFYESTIAKYLKKFGAKTITDKQGVTWNEIDVPKQSAKQPVQAFKTKPLFSELNGKPIPKAEALKIIRDTLKAEGLHIDVKVLFTDKFIRGIATGEYERVATGLNDEWRHIIRLYTEGGKVGFNTVHHEVGHVLVHNLLTDAEREAAFKIADKNLGPLQKAGYTIDGYNKNEVLDEYLADEYARQKRADAGFTGPFEEIFRKIDAAMKRLVEFLKKLSTRIDKFVDERGGGQGGFIKNPLAEGKGKITPEDAFKESTGQKVVGIHDGTTFEIGSYGENALERKIAKADRLPKSELTTTLKHITKEYVAGDSSFRKDNIVHVAEMPKGEKRAIVTRENAKGNAEIINFFKIGKNYDTFISNLEAFGTPGGIRTRDSLFRTQATDSTGQGGVTVPDNTIKNKVEYSNKSEYDRKGKTPEIQKLYNRLDREEQSLNAALQNPEGHAKAYGGNRVPEYEANITKLKTDIAQAEYDAKPQVSPDVLELEAELRVAQDALSAHPAKPLVKYANKAKGELPEVLGGLRTTQGMKNGIFGRFGDDIVTEAGFADSEQARRSYEDYLKQKIRVDSLEEEYKAAKRLDVQRRNIEKSILATEKLLAKANISVEKDIQKLAKSQMKTKLEQIKRNADTRKALAHENLRKLERTVIAMKPELEQEMLSYQVLADQAALPEYSELPSFEEVAIDISTPVKKKVNIIDYWRTPDRVLQKIGMGKNAKEVRTSYENYLSELPQHMAILDEWNQRVLKYGGSDFKIFQYLDGELKRVRDGVTGELVVDLKPEEYLVAEEIKEYLKDWAYRLGLPEDEQISHYITHIFEKEFIEKEFDEDMAKIIRNKIPGSVYDPFLEKRLGKKGYVQSTRRALEAYMKRAVRKANMDVALKNLKEDAQKLELSQYQYVKKYADSVNLRPSDLDNLVDNTIKAIFGYRFGGRPTAAATRTLRKFIFRGALGLNINSAIRNLTQGVNTYAKLGEKYTVIGYSKLLTQAMSKELTDNNILGQDMIQDKTLSVINRTMQKVDTGLFTMFQIAERVNRGAAYWGAKAKAIDMGMGEREAIDYAKSLVRDTQFTFGSIDSPAALRSDLAKTFFQFGSYAVKQTEFLSEMGAKKEWAGIIRYILASLALVYMGGKLFNIKWQDFVPNPLAMFGIGGSKFGAPSLALPSEIMKAILDVPGPYGQPRNWNQKGKDIARAGIVYVPAGTQLMKTYNGLSEYFGGKAEATPVNLFKASTGGKGGITKSKSLESVLDEKYGLKAKKVNFEKALDKKYGIK